MNVRRTLIVGAILALIYMLCLLGLVVSVHASTVSRYRRPYAVLIGTAPHDTETFKCHNRNFKLSRIYLFGGCKEIGNG